MSVTIRSIGTGRHSVSRRLCALAMVALVLGAVVLVAASHEAVAQLARHPFAVGAGEGAVGHQNAFGAWLLGQESRFYLSLTRAVRAARASAAGAAALVGLSFAYGVFHAAGPGHGKAVITSYMVSNVVALRRGLVISTLAALFQGVVATALVAIAAFVFHATAVRMTAAATTIEVASYVAIVGLGLALCWRKGRQLVAAVGSAPAPLAFAAAGVPGPQLAQPLMPRFLADDGAHVHSAACGCGHAHMPDPTPLAGASFDRKAAALAVVTAGARPCSGAILVLVFALAQGLFALGVLSTFAMALGTAVTTGALAVVAVKAKSLALRVAGAGSSRTVLVGRAIEFLAAAGVLLFGLALLAAWFAGAPTAA